MAVKVTLSFKDNIDDITLYKFLEEKGKLVGKSGYIKTLLKEAMEQQEKENE